MGVEIRWDPAFVEEAAFLVMQAREGAGDHRMAQAFHSERSALYETGNPREALEEGFQQLAMRTFRALGLVDLFIERLAEISLLASRVRAARVRRVLSRREECVELYSRRLPGDGSEPALLIGLQAARCLDQRTLTAFLRHELMHVSDMLDPAFGYDPGADLAGGCGVEDDLIRNRFRVLWDLFVEGRIRRRGWEPVVKAPARRREFERLFVLWSPLERDRVFQAVGDGNPRSQKELLVLARDERLSRTLGKGGVLCPLCRFPTWEGVRDWSGEGAGVSEAIRADCAGWDPAQGACRQCFEMYRSRIPVTR